MVSARPCPHCNHTNSARARFCSNCGKAMQEPTRTPSKLVQPSSSEQRPETPAVHQHVEKALGTVIGVLQGSIGAVNISPGAAADALRSPRHQVQPPGEEYIARRAVEDRLRALLAAAPGRLTVVELTGLPGSGKSSVGRKVACDLAAEFPDGRLWIEADDHSTVHMLWSLIDPFEEPPERGPFRDESQYRSVLNRALGHQRVLIVVNRVNAGNVERIKRILPANGANVAVLAISDSRQADLVDAAHSVGLPEMSGEEACQLFRMIWRDAYRSTSDDVIRELAVEFNFLPTQLALVARDILHHQVSPADYLAEIRTQKSARPYMAGTSGGFQTVYENLPELGRRALPFVGVIGSGAWPATTLAAVAQLPLDSVETALRQLVRVGFVKESGDGRFECSPAGREFALNSLRDLGGDALVRSAQGILAYQTLRASNEIMILRRQSILKDFLGDEPRKERFLVALRESFLPEGFGKSHGDTGTLQATPGLGDYDIVQDAFEEVVLGEPEFLARWQSFINTSLCIDQAHHLEAALRWAIDHEDWALTRSFYNVSIGVYVPELTAVGEKERKMAVRASGFRFGAIRNMRLSGAALESTLYGVRMIAPSIVHSELIGAYWGGVRLHRPTLAQVDMVDAGMPGLVVQDGALTDVDFRGADLRGAVFYNCQFIRANFRGADLRQARFLSSGGSDIDLRGARLEGIAFHNCHFARVVYYKADAERLPLKSDTTVLG